MNEQIKAQQQKPVASTFAQRPGANLQRKCGCGRPVVAGGECAGCRQHRLEGRRSGTLQRRAASNRTPDAAPPVVHEVLRAPGKPLDAETRAFMEPRFAYDFSRVRVHTGPQAADSARAINASAYTVGHNVVFGRGRYTPGTSTGKHLIAHELTHVLQQTDSTVLPAFQTRLTINRPGDKYEQEANRIAEQMLHSADPSAGPADEMERRVRLSSANRVQRDLALQSPPDVAAQPELTDEQIQEAIEFNRRRYSESSIRQIQDVVGAEVTGILDADTIRMIAQLQEEFGLQKDGKVGPNTFDLINRELTAEGAGTDTCLTSFRVTGPRIPMDLRALPGGLADIFTRFDVDIRFSPRCDCGDFEYRQFICGDVTRTTGGVTTSENHVFTNLPAGRLLPCPDWREDGDTSVPVRYGHRSAPGRPENRYLDDDGNVDQQNGCTFESFDVPGIWGLTAVSGSQYDFDIRFFGDVRRNGVGRVERKFWAVRDTVNIP